MSGGQIDTGCSFYENNRKLFVVGIGASAGGLQAIEEFFENMPADSGGVFVVVQHLSPDFKSLMKEILQRHTQMEIHRVTDGIELTANSIYLIPPDKNLIVEDNKLRLLEREDKKHSGPNFPIDLLFNSLAKNYQENATGVILSGTGSDGSLGLQAITQAGGFALVQDPSTAEFDGMPSSAIATLNLQKLPQKNLKPIITQIDSPSELAQLIYSYLTSPASMRQEYINSCLPLDDVKLKQITDILSQYQKVNYSFYKSSTLSRRIHRRCSATSCDNVQEYIKILQESDEEKQALSQDLSIVVTNFFRDIASWEYLSEEVIPDLIEKIQPDEELRFWVSGCATGEEAYSLAILVDEALENSPKKLRVKIFTTDINQNALETAAIGIYPATIAKNVDPERLEKYFIKQKNSFQVTRKLRDMLIFASHDLTTDVGFTRINLISCRNILIYMQPELQRRVLQNLHFSLKSQGILFLGDSEHLGNLEDEFIPINKKHKLYHKRRDVSLHIPTISIGKPDKISKFAISNISSAKNKQNKRELMLEKLLKTFLNANKTTCLIVNNENQVVEIFEDLANVLKIPIGKLTNNVTQIVFPSLQLPLNTALYRVCKEKHSVTYKGIKLVEEDNVRTIQLKVDLYEDNKVAGNLYMVSLSEQNIPKPLMKGEDFQPDSQASERISQLEYQLQQAEESFKTLIQELESIDEEHQAANEELTASNEELQSTNEELHSVNEELYTVNSQYQLKIHELIELNEDINNLLQSTNIGVVFLDKKLRIRKFTPATIVAINLIKTDINRPLKHLSHNLDCDNFIEIIQSVAQSEKSLDLEVKVARSDKYLLMRINPYIKDNGSIDGVVLSFIDINEIKTAQNQLQETFDALQDSNTKLNQKQAEFEAIFYSLPDAVIFTDTTRGIRMLNPGFSNLFGYQPQALIGKSAERLYADLEDFHKYNLELSDAHCDIHIESCEIKPYEINFRRRNGEIFVSETLKTTVKDSQGNVFGFLKLIRDISYRKQAEADLRSSEERFRSLYLRTPVMLHSMDKDGNILDVSNYWLQKLGYSRQEVIGKKFIQFLTSESHSYAQGILPEFFRNGSCWDIPYQFVCKNGEVIDTLLSAIADKDENEIVIRTLEVIIDITERKKAEAALRESEARFKTMADSAPVLIWMSEAHGKAVFFNKAWLECTGNSLEQQLGDGWLESIHPEDRDLCYETLCNVSDKTQPTEIQFRIRGVDAQYSWMLGRQVPRFNSQGEVIGYIGSCIDITEIKNAKEQLYRTNYQLEKSTIQLSRAKEAAESTNQAKSSFIAHMSHELRTPLNGILGFAQILQGDDTLTKEQRKKIDTIHQSGEHLLTLLNDILNLSKIEANQLELELKDIPFPLFIEKINSIINVRAQQKNISFKYEALSPLPAVIRGDETRLRQVLLNLLGNAVKFTDKGEVNFYISNLGKCEESTQENKDCLIRFKIEDTGIGIPLEKANEIFFPFHQLTQDDSINEGSGLGLTISQKIVNLMGGEIVVESTPEKGSAFYFDICVSEVEKAQTHIDINLEIQPIGVKGKHPKVLVIDDNKINRAVVISYLEQLGFEIDEASNGKQGLEKVESFKPDLILMDLVMPVMDGFETTQVLRNNPQFKDLPIIAVSANAMFDAQLSSYRVGCNAFLSKPIDLKLLIKSIAQFVEIEWIYPQSSKSPSPNHDNKPLEITAYQAIDTNEPILAPSDEQLNHLIHLTQIGDIEAIIEFAEHLEELDTKYLPFIKKVCELAQSFQQHKLLKFLENLLE